MRGWKVLAAVLLVTTGMAGCIGTSDEVDPANANADAGDVLDPSSVEAPDEASVEDVDTGVKLVLEGVDLPTVNEIQIPAGTTVVDLRVQAPEDAGALYPYMLHADTGEMRCTTQFADGWRDSPTEQASCAGVAQIDPLPANWTVGISAAGATSDEPVTADLVEVHFYDEPLDGVASRIDTANLSRPHHEPGEEIETFVESHDGESMFVDVHVPADGHDEWPTVLISSPYNTGTRSAGGQPYESTIEDFVQRGYAVAVTDVRGFGQSDGCVEVWGENERKDQAAIVDWITDQGFSDGHVGMMGVSYVGTTPTEAAVEAPEGLDAVIPVASVINAYEDWHYGGVPNVEAPASPAAYHLTGSQSTIRLDAPLDTVRDHGNGACDPTLIPRANGPQATYNEFYEERDFKQRVNQIDAAVLQQHGFVDATVKPAMIPGFFDELDEPKLGLFGHWSHNWATRADQTMLRLAWMDQFVKGNDVGLEGVSTSTVEANDGHRTGDWPPADADDTDLFPAFDEGELATNASESSATIALDPADTDDRLGADVPVDTELSLARTLDEPLNLAGDPNVTLDVTLNGAENAYVYAQLFHESDDGERLITYGASNLAHRGDHTTYEPFAPAERDQVPLPLQPTEYRVPAGDELRLVLRAAEPASDFTTARGAGEIVLHGGEDGTTLNLSTLDDAAYGEVPISVDPSPAS